MSKRRIAATVALDKPILRVYTFICDIAYYPFWTDISSVEKVSGTGEVGSIYTLTKRTMFGKESTPVEICQKVAPYHFAFQDKSKSFISEFGFQLKDLGEQTEITVYHEAQVRFFSGFLESNLVTGANTEVSLKKLLGSLQAALEDSLKG